MHHLVTCTFKPTKYVVNTMKYNFVISNNYLINISRISIEHISFFCTYNKVSINNKLLSRLDHLVRLNLYYLYDLLLASFFFDIQYNIAIVCNKMYQLPATC